MDEAANVALFLANIAWNREINPELAPTKKAYEAIIREFEEHIATISQTLKSQNYEQLIQDLQQTKRIFYPEDNRKIISCGLNERENFQVIWK